MNFRSIRWRLPLSYAAIALLAALSLGSVMLLVLDRYYTNQERNYLEVNAQSLQPTVEQALRSGSSPDSLQSLVSGLSFMNQTRIRLLDVQGNPLVDSGVPDTSELVSISSGNADGTVLSVPLDITYAGGVTTVQGETFQVDSANPLEGALLTPGGGVAVLTINASPYGYGFASLPASTPSLDVLHRSSQTVQLELSGSLGTLEISAGPAYGREILRSVSLAWAGAGLLATCLAALAGWVASRLMTRPVLSLEAATRRMQGGDLTTRVDLQEKHPAAEFQALADSFNDMAGRVEETVSTLRAFVADAAHELHTPLTALHTNLELAVDETDEARRALYLTRAREQDGRVEQLVNGLLDLSHIDAAGGVSERLALEINPLMRELGEQFASRAEQAGQSLTLELPEHPVHVQANEAQLNRILSNLLENALKFTLPGGEITLSLAAEQGQAVIRVADTGIGILPEDLPNLFERFHRGRNASRYPGSGLGLAIVRALVEAHEGRVQAESGPQGGTCLTVRLPLVS